MKRLCPRLFQGVQIISLLLLTACAVSARDAPAVAPDLSGNWSGHWESCTSGHSGPLYATFCKTDDTHYCVHFRGRFFKVIPFHYSVTLTVTGQAGDKVLLSGESYLGRLLGTFHYQAEADACDFTASYDSCRDHGRFVLHRCCSQAGCGN
jgi:hypothetical protein